MGTSGREDIVGAEPRAGQSRQTCGSEHGGGGTVAALPNGATAVQGVAALSYIESVRLPEGDRDRRPHRRHRRRPHWRTARRRDDGRQLCRPRALVRPPRAALVPGRAPTGRLGAAATPARARALRDARRRRRRLLAACCHRRKERRVGVALRGAHRETARAALPRTIATARWPEIASSRALRPREGWRAGALAGAARGATALLVSLLRQQFLHLSRASLRSWRSLLRLPWPTSSRERSFSAARTIGERKLERRRAPTPSAATRRTALVAADGPSARCAPPSRRRCGDPPAAPAPPPLAAAPSREPTRACLAAVVAIGAAPSSAEPDLLRLERLAPPPARASAASPPGAADARCHWRRLRGVGALRGRPRRAQS